MSNLRYPLLDALRGLAVVLMIAFHFCYDLNYFGFATFELYTAPFWLHSRTLIVAMFVIIAGMSLYCANHQGVGRGFWKREGLLLICSSLISIGTWFLFKDTWIFFGVLHFMLLGSVLALPFIHAGKVNIILGILLIIIGNFLSFPFFDQQSWQFIGLMTHKPFTEDYVPLLPWFGVLLIGISLGAQWGKITYLQRPLTHAAWKPLLWLGQHSLIVYMLHQPLLFTLFWVSFSLR
ncbi:DUF1624 domain-containing protein [Thiofilum flexile]|uniref:DUF1624 domain-containing protein n=1 Tax=Thiofilum flexile TaxID=125627 RepID=UPI00037C210E|nr:heparan-alpha-glucosaminide N-acetyltransferase [Thiofilum flexile]